MSDCTKVSCDADQLVSAVANVAKDAIRHKQGWQVLVQSFQTACSPACHLAVAKQLLGASGRPLKAAEATSGNGLIVMHACTSALVSIQN